MATLLIVEDDTVMRSALTLSLKGAGYEVEGAENGFKALEIAGRKAFDCIISDIRMPGLDGVTMVRRFKERSPKIKSILITGYSDDEPLVRALNLGVDGILKKPFGMKELLRVVSLKLEEKEAEEARERQQRELFLKIEQALGKEEAVKILGTGIARPAGEEPGRLATLSELGRMAEMRGEKEAALQAYEEALALLPDTASETEEFSIRLSLSNLFAQKGDQDIAVLHANEALTLAAKQGNGPLTIEARLHLGKLLLGSDPGECATQLDAAGKLLLQFPSAEKQARRALLACGLALKRGSRNEAGAAVSEFLSFGKRHFLPQLLVAFQEIGVPALIVGLEEKVETENALWLLEEAAPFVQERLSAAASEHNSIRDLLSGYVACDKGARGVTLRVHGLGKLVMYLNQAPLLDSHWRSLKGRSLLLYLFNEHPKLLSEEHMLDTFWPNLTPEKGRHALRTTLYFIRRTIGTEEVKNILHTEKQKFGIRADASFSCDFISFRDLFLQAKASWQKGEKDRAAMLIKEGEKLYKGAFLEGWSEEWNLAARDFYSDAFCWMMVTLSSYLKNHREWSESLRYAKRALDVEPTLEEAHYFAIEALIEGGKREEAVKQFNACKSILQKELGVEPSERTHLLYLKALDVKSLR